ncbi:hypothetical protein BH10CYA1_BH10CYA1_40170 [soil metagenome]
MFNWIEDYIKAGSPKVSAKQLALLAYSKHPKIRLRVAENPKTPEEVLAFLSGDKEPDVRLAVGTAVHTPAYLIEKLSGDLDPTVRHGIAEDLSTPRRILKMLAEDDNAYVSCRALKTLESLRSAEIESRSPLRSDRWANPSEQCFA